MQLHCTRPNCPSPSNHFSDLDNPKISRPLKQKFCSACRMELILGGRYLPVSVLGQGGFGTAFLARDFDSPTQRRCVVKLFQPPVTLTPQQMATAQRLFAREAEVLERLGLQHPQIPNLYAYFPLPITNPLTNQLEELFYLVQEYVDGEDLEKVRHRQGKLTEAEVDKVLRAMLDVLDFVHSNGAIHRDVKPSNIIHSQNGRLSLLDFGAVKEVTTPTGVQRGPTTICSPDYAPPEQIMNGTVDATSDLYALAATCVVLLTDKDSSELRDSSSNSWNWRSEARVSPGFAQVLDRMLRAKPSDRYPSAKAVLAALSAGSSQPPSVPSPLVTPPTPVASSAPPARPPVQPAPQPIQPLSLPRFLGNAAFAGAEGGLLAIAAISLLGTTFWGGGVWLAMLAGLVLLQARRVIEGTDLVIIAGLTLAAVIFFPPLHNLLVGGLSMILVVTVMAGGLGVAIAVIFRLIFRLVSRIM
ncbi:protein kinase [Leptolyngbya sp. BC1307]|uniref:protein kinase domain-containing protein n=1 Tax=Leptolyngbya sp. BC1307 TaxID=2029589 RepID=UPI000EFB68D5